MELITISKEESSDADRYSSATSPSDAYARLLESYDLSLSLSEGGEISLGE